jgi:putative tricarboxylic transport membrane protein
MSAERAGPARGPNGLVKADFVTGLVLFALGGATLVESLRMPRFEELNVNPYTAPGLVPGVLGLVLLVLGAVLFVRAARAGGWRLGTSSAVAHSADPGVYRLALCVALCLGYAAGLVGRLPFWLATFLFVAAFVALFEWPRAASRADRRHRLIFAVLFAAIVSAAVTLVFQRIFLVRLP